MFNMQRDIYARLIEWKNKDNRKPLILNGARQVGKTYILRKFGENEYAKCAFFSLDRNYKAVEVFENSSNPGDILRALSAIAEVDITDEDTLVVIDEIQNCPKALETLKFFCEDMPRLHIIVAGSLLGLSLHNGVSYPVGKVEELRLYPMTFIEFLKALEKNKLADLLHSKDWAVINLVHTELVELLRQYYFVGGMPAAVSAYVQNKGLQEVRAIQKQIIADYRRDFSKHAPVREVPRINMVWDSIPAQLAKENKKFIYGVVRKSGRATDFELAIQWLEDAGLAYKVTRVSSPHLPLKFYENIEAFKLFMLDVGLMGAMADVPAANILIGDTIFSEYKGAFTELYVFTQLKTTDRPIYYHATDSSTIEIDFIIQQHDAVIPIEVKAEENVKAKSLKTFLAKYPELQAVRFSMLPYKVQDRITNIPLYACLAL